MIPMIQESCAYHIKQKIINAFHLLKWTSIEYNKTDIKNSSKKTACFYVTGLSVKDVAEFLQLVPPKVIRWSTVMQALSFYSKSIMQNKTATVLKDS